MNTWHINVNWVTKNGKEDGKLIVVQAKSFEDALRKATDLAKGKGELYNVSITKIRN